MWETSKYKVILVKKSKYFLMGKRPSCIIYGKSNWTLLTVELNSKLKMIIDKDSIFHMDQGYYISYFFLFL